MESLIPILEGIFSEQDNEKRAKLEAAMDEACIL